MSVTPSDNSYNRRPRRPTESDLAVGAIGGAAAIAIAGGLLANSVHSTLSPTSQKVCELVCGLILAAGATAAFVLLFQSV